jgi:hypothetical protein
MYFLCLSLLQHHVSLLLLLDDLESALLLFLLFQLLLLLQSLQKLNFEVFLFFNGLFHLFLTFPQLGVQNGLDLTLLLLVSLYLLLFPLYIFLLLVLSDLSPFIFIYIRGDGFKAVFGLSCSHEQVGLVQA